MGLKMMKDTWKVQVGDSGKYRTKTAVRRIWYGQYKDGGRYKVIKLTTPMRGEVIPDTLSGKGDAAFEKSRALAQAEFDRFEAEREVKGSTEHLTRILIESKTGQKIDDVRVDELELKWRQSHIRNRSENWDKSITWLFKTFTDSVSCTYLYEVTPAMVSAFYKSIRKQYSWNTVTRMMKLVSGAFSDLLPIGAVNPFSKVEVVPDKSTQSTIHRKPLSEDELDRLFEESRKDPMLYALTVATACTGMRIGDVCNLKWESVDLRGGFIDVKTRKTGAEVTLPIFPKLREVLEGALVDARDNDGYVFPDAAQMHKGNYDGLIRMGKILFARALFKEDAEREANITDANHKDKTPAETMELIRNAGYAPSKTEKVLKVYSLYRSGMTYRQIQREMGCSRGLICGYLHGIEDLTGDAIIKGARESATSNRRLLQRTRQERKVGKRSASLYGWHSLRASFVVAALTNGIPIEVVRKVVGHATTQMTQEYFNPTKRIMADTLRRRMSGSILAAQNTPALTGARKSIGVRGAKTPIAPRPALADAVDGELAALAARLARMSPTERKQLKALLDR